MIKKLKNKNDYIYVFLTYYIFIIFSNIINLFLDFNYLLLLLTVIQLLFLILDIRKEHLIYKKDKILTKIDESHNFEINCIRLMNILCVIGNIRILFTNFNLFLFLITIIIILLLINDIFNIST